MASKLKEEKLAAQRRIDAAKERLTLDGTPLPSTAPTVSTEKKDDKKTGNVFKDYSGLIFGGGAALLSFFFGGNFLTSLLLGVGGFFLGNAFGPKVVDSISGLFGGDKKPNTGGNGLERSADEQNVAKVQEVTGMVVSPKDIEKANADKDGNLSKDELKLLAENYKKSHPNYTFDEAKIDSVLPPTGIPLASTTSGKGGNSPN